jgi:hypothetical protein
MRASISTASRCGTALGLFTSPTQRLSQAALRGRTADWDASLPTPGGLERVAKLTGEASEMGS